MYALKEDDLKGLLAYSSIDNTGVILIGTGLFVVLTATGHASIGTMALLGAVFHAVSHGLFKGLLFLTAGSVNQATGTRNIDELGGLLVRMPWTGGLFFIGVLAISALPPLNGFAGELLIYQALITGLMESEPLMQVVLVIALSLFGLTGALTAVCFVKAFGLTFLALPRTRAAKQAREVPTLMLAGPAILAGGCIVAGIFSSQILTVLGYPGYLARSVPHLGSAHRCPGTHLRCNLHLRLTGDEGLDHMGMRNAGSDKQNGVHRIRIHRAGCQNLCPGIPDANLVL